MRTRARRVCAVGRRELRAIAAEVEKDRAAEKVQAIAKGRKVRKGKAAKVEGDKKAVSYTHLTLPTKA